MTVFSMMTSIIRAGRAMRDRRNIRRGFEAEVAGMSLNANCIDFTVEPTTAGQLASFTADPPTAYAPVKNECVTGNANGVRLDRPHDGNLITLAGETPARGPSPVSITIHDPPMFAATVLSECIARGGIKVAGTVKRDRTIRQQRAAAGAAGQNKWQVIAIHETPIPPVLARCNKDSMNVYAESLCKRIGFESTQEPGSWENGTSVVGRVPEKDRRSRNRIPPRRRQRSLARQHDQPARPGQGSRP